jgi:hypothetical protein
LLIVEDPTVTVKCGTAIKALYPLLEFVSKCNVGYYLMFICIHELFLLKINTQKQKQNKKHKNIEKA